VKLTDYPFSVDPDELPLHLQLEFTELQFSAVYRNMRRESSLRDIYKSLDSEKYKNVIGFAQKTFSITWKHLHM
jgi:hypothetical protein